MQVLIESDWNLKHAMMDIDIAAISINRIRLEFKGRRECQDLSNKYGINRIILEFKAYMARMDEQLTRRINRIILEFKDYLII